MANNVFLSKVGSVHGPALATSTGRNCHMGVDRWVRAIDSSRSIAAVPAAVARRTAISLKQSFAASRWATACGRQASSLPTR